MDRKTKILMKDVKIVSMSSVRFKRLRLTFVQWLELYQDKRIILKQ